MPLPRLSLSVVVFIALTLVLGALPVSHAKEAKNITPSPRREFRAAWIATVANIDWPSKPGLSTEGQKQELIALLDCAVELNLNAIVFQVRPHCDALYESELEPWSEYLTGTMGKAPQPFYDPLKLAVEECHRRGLELHAWFNPYRASHPAGKSELTENHISKTKPEAVREYGKYLWLDPGEPSAVDHSLAVILDVVRRYDIDGVHFDDYFYPYPINDEDEKPVDFPDEASWKKFQTEGVSLSRNDWRRQNVNQFIARVAQEVKKAKPWVKFGVSPFGIWRPGYPSGVTGFDAYDKLYADSQKWFHEGTVDYLTPQLYWKLGSKGQSYSALLRWWQGENKQSRHLWPGQYTSRLLGDGANTWPSEEIVAQIWATRAQEGATGNVHFSMKALARNSGGIADDLKSGAYQEPALVPATPWLDQADGGLAFLTVSASRREGKAVVRFATGAEQSPWLWAISAKYGPHWKIHVVPGHNEELELPETYLFEGETHSLESVDVSAVNRLGRQSNYFSTVYSPDQSQ